MAVDNTTIANTFVRDCMYKGKLTRKVKFSYTHTKKLIFQKVLMLEQIWPQTGAPRALVKIVWMQEQICKLIAAYRLKLIIQKSQMNQMMKSRRSLYVRQMTQIIRLPKKCVSVWKNAPCTMGPRRMQATGKHIWEFRKIGKVAIA
ncbi:uncharacterized protein [Drosophila virilis]|uniref:uncharacterized protein isoform X2 n=1 Tax=Drosophila virilis TaxID=7244 RepID=UPI0038B24C15